MRNRREKIEQTCRTDRSSYVRFLMFTMGVACVHVGHFYGKNSKNLQPNQNSDNRYKAFAITSDAVTMVRTKTNNVYNVSSLSSVIDFRSTELQEKTLVTNHAIRNAIEDLAQRAASLTPAPATNEQPPPPASNEQPPPLPPPADTVVTITRGRDGSVGMRFRHPKGCSSGPLEVIAVEPGGPAEFSGLGVRE